MLSASEAEYQQQFIQYPVGSSTTSVAVGDFNDDSVLDLATTDDFGAVWVLPGVGNGTFGTPMSFPVNDAFALTVGNFDANPLPDMAVASPDPNEVAVLLNNTPRSRPGPSVSVAAGGSCASSGLAGTISGSPDRTHSTGFRRWGCSRWRIGNGASSTRRGAC